MPDQAAMASYDPRAAAACVAEFAQRECPLLKAPPHEPSACDDVYARGNRQVGEPCQTSYECAQAPGMLTGCAGASVGEGIDGSCVNYEWAGEGESCHSDRRGISVRCEGALVCDNQRGICMRRAEHGESCLSWPTFGDTCAPGSVCDHEGSGRCVAPIPVGEPCGPDIEGQCEGFACIHDACREPLSHANFVTCEG